MTQTISNQTGTIDELIIDEGMEKTGGEQWLLIIDESCDGLTINHLFIDGHADEKSKAHFERSVHNAALIAAKNVTIERMTIRRVHVGVEARRADGLHVKSWVSELCSGDLIQGNSSNVTIENGHVYDALLVFPYERYHADLIHWRGECSNVHINGLTLHPSKHPWARRDYQALMLSDGVFTDCHIENLKLPCVHVEHAATFAEAHNCTVKTVWGGGAVRFLGASTNCQAIDVDGVVVGATEQKTAIKDDSKQPIIKEAIKMDTQTIINKAALELDVEEAAICAVIAIESAGKTGAMLFERHVFYRELQRKNIDITRLLLQYPQYRELLKPNPFKAGRCKENCYGTHANQTRRLEMAAEIDRECALLATSFGSFQIMGFNHKIVGFDSVFDFYDAMQTEAGQLQAFIAFIKHKQLDVHLRNRDWESFAYYYNGKNHAKNNYAPKLAREYQRCIAAQQPKKSLTQSRTVTGSAVGGLITTAVATVSSVGLSDAKEAIAKLKEIKTQLTEVGVDLESITGMMNWMPWAVGGIFVLLLGIFGLIVYAYLHDHGYLNTNEI